MASITDAARWVMPWRMTSSSPWKPLRRSRSWVMRLTSLSSEAAGHVVLRPGVRRVGEDLLGLVELDETPGAPVTLLGHLGGVEGRTVTDPGGLLHVVGHDHDREAVLELSHQSLDAGRRNRVESRARLVHEDDLGLDGDGPGDAEPLLLTPRHAQGRRLQAVLHLIPQRGAAQRTLDDVVELGLLADAVDAGPEGDVVVDALRERVRALEHHADVA